MNSLDLIIELVFCTEVGYDNNDEIFFISIKTVDKHYNLSKTRSLLEEI